ncbi:putative Subunit H2 [Hibiscus syriacus]|uniref:RING-type E3 ubiquitin transferase n=1 Tax=Hibiscus syriacus TaxID=106335 RepID=A0A6A3A4S0_HIBSY|nr:RING-H2 finger protein ATL2-like [Hibiscus syriacus]KAE8698235.1 putative Subunit H2 [Hibiscus syriacus]
MSGNNNGIRNPSSFPPGGDDDSNNGSSYALGGKIMLSAIVVLFFVVVLMFALHIYARWYLRRARRRHSRNRRRRLSQIVFYVDDSANPAVDAASSGLDSRVLNLLPAFTFSSQTYPDSVLECAVCLSEFEENESGRVLPKCNHSFHMECIDLWFHSHSTCPLCRTSVQESVPVSDNTGDLVITVNEPSGGESGSNLGSDLCNTCQHGDGPAGSSAVGFGRKLSIEVPKRNIEGFIGESSGCESGPSQSYKSPMSRILSFKRILSRDRRGSGTSPCPSPINATVSESAMERGVDETRQSHS